MIKKHYYKDAFNTLKWTYIYNTSKSKSTYIPTRVSSENGKSFRKKFAFFRISFAFFAKLRLSVSPKKLQTFREKNKCENFSSKTYLNKGKERLFLAKIVSAKFCETVCKLYTKIPAFSL